MKRFNDFFRCMSPLVLFMLFFSTTGASAMKSNGPAADGHDSIRIRYYIKRIIGFYPQDTLCFTVAISL